MRSRRCLTDHRPGVNYCAACGAALVGRTGTHPPDDESPGDPSAGATIPDAFRRLMPDQFVEKLVSSRGRIQGERRIVTIMFCDVKGSTALAESLDPEEVMDIMNDAFEAMIGPVLRQGGTLARLMGDGILAFFGAPVAHEDDPVRACRAGLGILEEIGVFARRLEKERCLRGFNVRVGINTGTVVVGEVGNAIRVEYTAMGDAVNVAARMEATADPGTIRITDATRRLVGRLFQAEPLGGLEIRGKSRPVRVHRLTGLCAEEADAAVGAEGRSPFVGRRNEYRTLARSVAALADGIPSVVVVTGEAGVGKSRLVAEVQAAFPGVGWFHCRAVPDGTLTGDSMTRQLIASLCGVGRHSPPGQSGEALRTAVLTSFRRPSPGVYACLARLLNVHPGAEGEAFLQSIDAESLQARTAEALRIFLDAMAKRRPLAIVWDDLHFIDPGSARLLAALLESPSPSPLLLMLLSRPGEDRTERLVRSAVEGYGSRCRIVELRPLPKHHGRKLMAGIVEGRALPPAVRREILEKTGGNAFFIEEVLRSILDGNPQGRGRRAANRREEIPLVVPETVAGVITARMDRLGDLERAALQAAAVIGRDIRAQILAPVLDLTVGDPRFTRAIDELSRKDFIVVPSGRAGWISTPARQGSAEAGEYGFKHGLTREVVYGGMLLPHRSELHRRVGEALEAVHRPVPPETSATVAFHFDQAGVAGKAYRYTLEAAVHAKRTYAGQEAVMYYTRALSLATDTGAENAEMAGIHDALGEVFAFLARYPDAIANFNAALSAGPPRGSRPVILRKRARVFEQWGRYAEADADLHEALSILGDLPDQAEEARVRIGLARVCFRRGELAAAAGLGEAALAAMDLRRDPAGTAEACNILGNVYAKCDDLPRAISLYDRSRLLWEEMGHQGGLSVAYNNLGQVYHQLGRWDEAINHYLRSLGLSERTGDRYGTARTCDNLSQVYAELGNQDEAMRCLKRAVDIFREIGREGSTVVPEMWVQSGTL